MNKKVTILLKVVPDTELGVRKDEKCRKGERRHSFK